MTPQFCTKCGAALDAQGQCPNEACAAIHTATAPSKADKGQTFNPFEKNRTVLSEKDKRIVPDCVQPEVGEKPICQYDIARLRTLIKWAFSAGRLQVTNKRVLFRATGHSIVGPSCIQHEFSIEEIAGIEIRKEATFNFFTTILLAIFSAILVTLFEPIFSRILSWKVIGRLVLLLLAVASAFIFFLLPNRRALRHVALTILFAGIPWSPSLFKNFLSPNALCSLMILLAFILSFLSIALAPNLNITIRTKGGTPSIEIRKKDGLFSFQHNQYTGFSQVMPGPDVDKAIQELGAVIREVQKTGNYSN